MLMPMAARASSARLMTCVCMRVCCICVEEKFQECNECTAAARGVCVACGRATPLPTLHLRARQDVVLRTCVQCLCRFTLRGRDPARAVRHARVGPREGPQAPTGRSKDQRTAPAHTCLFAPVCTCGRPVHQCTSGPVWPVPLFSRTHACAAETERPQRSDQRWGPLAFGSLHTHTPRTIIARRVTGCTRRALGGQPLLRIITDNAQDTNNHTGPPLTAGQQVQQRHAAAAL